MSGSAQVWVGRALAAAALALSLGGLPPPGEAAPARQAIALAPAVGEAPPEGRARGVFYSATLSITVGAAEALLASSPDGLGELCTDDEATLVFRREGAPEQVWSRLFADRAAGAVRCAPPQHLLLAAGAGAYQVEVILADRFPFTHSSRPYFLIVAAPATGIKGAATPPAPPAATTPPAPVAAPTSTRPSATATPGAGVAALTSAVPAAQPAPTPPLTGGPEAPLVGGGLPTPALLAALGAAALAMGLVALLARRRPPPRAHPLAGIVDLADRETGEARTELLGRFPGGAALVRGPLRLVTPGGPAEGRAVASIVPGEGGPLLRVGPAEPTPLREGEALLIDRAVELRYRGARATNRPPTTVGRRP